MVTRARASLLAKAIQGERWELVALCLLLGLTRALAHIPPDAIEGVLDVLEGDRDDQGKKPGRGD
ncbi:MAG: hypothetical protein HY669_02855 [Chloroflexi bacterium]|nr:hypothetical protein [Chloroflexota bacterium]